MNLEPNFCKGSLILKKSLLDKLLSPINLTLCVPLINKPNKSLANVPEFPASIVTLLLIWKLPSPFPVIEHMLLLKVIFNNTYKLYYIAKSDTNCFSSRLYGLGRKGNGSIQVLGRLV